MIGDLIRQRQAELRERFEAMVAQIAAGEATHFEMDPLIAEAEWLAALAHARLAELEALYGGGLSGGQD